MKPKDVRLFDLNFSGTAVITDQGAEIQYPELADFADAFARGMPSRSLVFCLTENSLGSLVGYVGCLRNRHVPLMIDKKLDKLLLRRFIELYSPAFIWAPKSRAEELPGELVFEKHGYSLLRMSDSLHYQMDDRLALLLTTSGSTGSPKLVRQSYLNIAANTQSIIEYLALDASERPITTLPMNYTYGLSVINTHLSCGGTLLLTDHSLIDREFWDFFNKYQATSIAGVPYTYEMLERFMFFRRRLPSLKTMTQAGGKILPVLHEKFARYAKENQKKFVVMYGQCEATARMSYLPPDRALDKVGSMGIAIPGGKLRLVDETGVDVTDVDTVGELVYEGENVTLGYAESGADLCKGDERNGVLHTGDMAKRDSEGFFFVVGRKKRFLKMFGNRVNLDETERLIKSRFMGLDCACSGVDDLMKVYITDHGKADEVRDFVASVTHLNFSAIKVMYLAEIPKNNSGKPLYAKLEV